MIDQTTLKIIVRAIDEATGPLNSVEGRVNDLGDSSSTAANKVDELSAASDDASNTVDDLGGIADKASGRIDDLGESAEGTAKKTGGLLAALGPEGLVGVAVLAGTAIYALATKLWEVHEKHVELQRVADRLNLPVEKVKGYSDAWLKVAQRLEEVRRGFGELSAAQTGAFKALGIDVGVAGAGNSALSRIAAASGERNDKVDALSILFGISFDQAEKQLDDELKRLREQVIAGTSYDKEGFPVYDIKTRAQLEGVQFGKENISDLRRSGALPTDTEIKQSERNAAALTSILKTLEGNAKEHDKVLAGLEADRLKREDDALQVYRSQMREIEAINQAKYDAITFWEDAEAQAIEDNNELLADSTKESLQIIKPMIAEIGAEVGKLEEPFKETTDFLKDMLRSLALQGEISAKRLVEAIIFALLQKRLYDAIDKLAAALNNALNPSVGGGGFIGKLIGAVAGHGGGTGVMDYLPGEASGGVGSGIMKVGEDGPEVIRGGINTFKVYNRRQLAGMGAGKDSGNVEQRITFAPTNNFYGADTAQVIGYVERSREQDRRALVQMLYDNGLGRMR